MNNEVIPSGSLRLDIALGTGGYPRGSIIEIYGTPESGKSTLCLHAIAEAQKYGGACVFIDVDHTLNPAYAVNCGVDLDQMYLSSPEPAEQTLDTAMQLIASGGIILLVIDSVSALVPQQEIDISLGSQVNSTPDQLLSQNLRRLTSLVRQTKTNLIMTNHAPMKMSAIYHDLKSNPQRLAIKLHADLRLKTQQKAQITENQANIGYQVTVQIVKNSFVPCFNQVGIDIIYNEGIRKEGEILELGLTHGIIVQRGKQCAFLGQLLGGNLDQALDYLTQNPEVAGEIEQRIRQELLPPDHTPTRQ